MKKLLMAITALVIIAALNSGCKFTAGQDEGTAAAVEYAEQHELSNQYNSKPIKKTDGGKFKIAYVDIDPYYNETFKMLYYVIEELKESGWIYYDKLPFDVETYSDSCGLINWLADNAQSEYLEFDKTANYYTRGTSEKEIYDSLSDHINAKHDIDMIISMGTEAGVLMEKFDFDVPLLMYGVVNAVNSGLVRSEEYSGYKNRWAHVDDTAYIRQMQKYHNIFRFNNIGMVYGDEVTCAIPHYETAARENGFNITKYQLARSEYSEDEYYRRLGEIYRDMINDDKVDAYILNTDVIPDANTARKMLSVFFEAGIPVFTQIGISYTLEGASLMTIDVRDPSSSAEFMVSTIGAVLNGTDPSELKQEYASAPYMVLNLNVADLIGYKPSFDLLLSCEKLVCANA